MSRGGGIGISLKVAIIYPSDKLTKENIYEYYIQYLQVLALLVATSPGCIPMVQFID